MSAPLRQAMGSLTKFGTAVAGIGTAVGGIAIVTDSVKKAMNFEAQLSSIKALTNSTDAQMKSIQALALEQGATTKYSAMEAAQAIEELLKAGMSLENVQGGGLNAALNLATAGGLELAEAAETMATSMNAFKKDGLSAAETSDILAGTANAAATDIRSIGYAIASAGGVADMAGVSFRDLNAAIGLMSNDGLKSGSDAGTSFKSMLMYLQPQTKKAINLFEELGIGVGKANKFFENGKIKGLADIAQLLRDVTKDMTDQERTATFLDMFGTDGVKAATTLYKAGAAGVKKFYDEMSTTTAMAVAQEKMNNAAGAVEQFQGAVETLQISALMPTMPILKDLATEAAKFVTKYTPQITAAVEKAVNTAKNYLSNTFINNPAFRNLPDINAKVNFIFVEMKKIFDSWWNSGGKEQTEAAAKNVTDFLLNTLEAAIPRMVEIGLKLGMALASGILEGLSPVKQVEENIANTDWVNDAFDFTNKYLPEWMGGVPDEELARHNAERREKLGNTNGTPVEMFAPKTIPGLVNPFKNHSSGLDRVPYSGYKANLHKDEAVLTRGEASEWRAQQNGGSGGQILITGNTFNVRQESDIDAIAKALARQMANA